MPISREQVNALYEGVTDASVKLISVSNMDLLDYLYHKNQYVSLIASVLLRPHSAMRFHLLPALAAALEYQRPVAGSGAVVPHNPTTTVVRSVSLLLEFADPEWIELPDSWVSLGSVLANQDMTTAREFLDTILAGINVKHPIRVLRQYCSPLANSANIIRHFKLSPAEMEYFKIREKEETIKKISEADQ